MNDLFRKLLSLTLSYFLVLTACKPRRESNLSSDATSANLKDYNGFIVAIEKYKTDALSGGFVQGILEGDQGGSSKSRSYKSIMQGLIELAQNAQMPHIVRLAMISRAETLYKLGDPDYEDGLSQVIAGMNDCKFPIPCMTMMAEFYTLSNLKAEESVQALGNNSRLRQTISQMDEPSLIKNTVQFKLDTMFAYANFIRIFSDRNAISNFGVSTQQTYPHQVEEIRRQLGSLKDTFQRQFRPNIESSEIFGNAIVGEFSNNGSRLTLADLDAETRKNIVSESNLYRSELTQLYITINALEELTKRISSRDPEGYYRSMAFDSSLEGQGRFASLTMFSTYESSIPSRYAWLQTVQRGAQTLGAPYQSIADGAQSLVSSIEGLMHEFLKADPYFTAVERSFNLSKYLMTAERNIIREEPTFQSIPYQVLKLKGAQQNFNREVQRLNNKSESEMKAVTALDNFKYAQSDVNLRYLTLMCAWTKSRWRGASQNVRNEGRKFIEFVPPYECKAPTSFSYNEGNWKYADSECQSHAYKLSERDICGDSTSFQGYQKVIRDNLTKLEIKKIWDPVITKGIILTATALSIIVTMGATSYLAIGAAGATTAAAGTTAATIAQISFAARAGYYVLNALVGSIIFTATNNAILLATGVKRYDSRFWGSVGKEFLIGFGMMLFLPLGALAGEAIAAKATTQITNEFYKALITKGATVGVDTLAFLPMVPASIAIMNILDGTPGRTWKDLSRLDLKEEVLLALLFSLGLRMNLKGNYYTKNYSFKQEFGMAIGRK